LKVPFAWLAASIAFAAQAHQGAHVHGLVKLGVAVQGSTVSIQLESPLDNLLGFEHRPRTAAQRKAAHDLLERMRTARDLFRFDAGAQCALSRSRVESDALDEGKAAAAPAASASAEAEHADLDASFEFTCREPGRLTSMDVGLFDAFERIARIEAAIVTDHGQFKRELGRPQRAVSLQR